ncbi:interleukin-4 receptor subunit alpha isoform X1 [Marmota monax]|uniref:interleukin-4 receptor subunit alpha isoform X1 n=1 Tax=Marmota monax TaxID=9995 RepID=UPI001EAFCD13|nr:interleukin-4 receptor subunit alpha isoform X1 [Marmota monax]XP_046310504.1 interleukin-4 receptor subunit alpha isoform X1 [Marmota monax]XP_046310505.1 interleukin-4 receptor subunit alpha isoform X1 [Marmota monax]KAI6051961.1 IL4R [Marmota monax]KAI6062660.1 IL4R [Marmota monax]
MGWLCSHPLSPVSCLILVWVTVVGSMRVLREPTCFSDYISVSTCEWQLDSPLNCSAELHLSYWLDFEFSENRTCIPENSAGATCVCIMPMDDLVKVDTYQLVLWAGRQQVWHGLFKPSDHVKPRAPENLTVHTSDHDTKLLTWSNPYPPGSTLYKELTYLVNISNENDPAEFIIYNVTYMEPTLRLAASTLKSGVSYKVRVRAWTESYNGTWSDWSPSAQWHNYYQPPLVQRLPMGVGISCLVIMAICLSCYYSVTKIKKEWWDQIPNPARSPLMAIVIQDSQVSLWERRPPAQEPTKCPHWKTCLAKLLPCLLEHDVKRDEEPKAAAGGPLPGPEKPTWRPVVLWPENISVAPCVELLEAPVERGEEAEEEEKASVCPSPEHSGGFQGGCEGIMVRLTESLFLDLLGAQDGGCHQRGSGDLCCLPPPGGDSALPSVGPEGAASEDKGPPFHPEPAPPASTSQGPASPGCSEGTLVVADNPAYRSLQSQALGPAALDPDAQLAGCPASQGPRVPRPPEPPTELQPEPETWEQILRQSVLQHRAATVPASAPSSGYRELAQAVGQGGAQDSSGAGPGPSGEAGYRAFSSLLTPSAPCTGTAGLGAGSGDRGYKPFHNLVPGFPGDLAPLTVPLFTFGLDMEPPHGPQNSLLPSPLFGQLGLEPEVKGEDGQKPLLPPDPLRDDLGSGIVYSALTCHLCGHLKQHQGQEGGGQAHVVAGPCCGCHCGDRSSPPGSPMGALDPRPGGLPLEAHLAPAPQGPLGALEESKSSLSFQSACPAPCSAPSSSETPRVALVSTGPSS